MALLPSWKCVRGGRTLRRENADGSTDGGSSCPTRGRIGCFDSGLQELRDELDGDRDGHGRHHIARPLSLHDLRPRSGL
jgi:hypothetical protein